MYVLNEATLRKTVRVMMAASGVKQRDLISQGFCKAGTLSQFLTGRVSISIERLFALVEECGYEIVVREKKVNEDGQ